MTKSTITRERIQRIIRAINSEAYDEEEIREWLSSDEIMELSRMALAAMDSEPVAYISKSDFDAGYPHILARRDFNKACTLPVYAAQPAPEYPEVLPCPVLLEPGMRFGKGVKTRLVLEAIQRRAEHHAELEDMAPEERAEYDANIEAFKAMLPLPAPVVPDAATAIRACLSEFPESARDIVEECADIAENACRAAMLHAGNSPAQSDCCPAQNCIHSAQGVDRPVAWHHSAKSKEENHGTCCFSYASSHDFGPRYEKPQSQPHYLPERLDYDRALHFLSTEPRKVTPETVIGGNSPVIPDGYVLVPKEATKEILDEFDSIIDYGAEDSVDAWHRLLAAAPQEVKP